MHLRPLIKCFALACLFMLTDLLGISQLIPNADIYPVKNRNGINYIHMPNLPAAGVLYTHEAVVDPYTVGTYIPNGILPLADVPLINVETQNRELQLDFVKSMLMFNNMSTLTFTPAMNRSFRASDTDSIRKAFGVEIYSVPVINLGGKNWYGSRPYNGNTNRRARWLHTVHLIPQINVRILLNNEKFNDFSLPVRTPSYLQGGAWYFTHSKFWRRPLHKNFEWTNAGLIDREALMDLLPPRWLQNGDSQLYNLYQTLQNDTYGDHQNKSNTGWYGRWRNWHYSDGQDGWDQDSVSMEQYKKDAKSLFHQFDRETGEFNTYNGDFGINVVGEIALGFVRENIKKIPGWYLLKAKGKSMRVNERVRRHNVTLGWEYAYVFFGGMETMKKDFYSTNRLNINYNFIQLKKEQEISPSFALNSRAARRTHIRNNTNHWYGIQNPHLNEKVRVLVETTYLMDKMYRIGNLYKPDTIAFGNVSRRLNATITMHLRLRGTGNASFFTQAGYYGSDPYSVYYMTRRYFVRCGIGWGFFISGEAVRDFE